MNAERLLALYEKVAEAPDAIARLRRFVLDLAVRGKLVEQNPNDEPASELLKRIAAEKARLVKARMIRKPKPTAPIGPAELPISVPPHWAWLRLGDIGTLSGGMTPSKSRPDFWDGDVVWLSPKDIKADEVYDSELKITTKGLNETRLGLFPAGSLFVVARSGILKRTFPVSINRVPAASNQDLKVLVPYLKGQEQYLQIMFRGMTDFLLTALVKQGTTVQSLKYAEFEVQPFPIPPIAEQRRIVAKVEELLALLDRLEAARTAREATRDRLSAASLNRLTAPDTIPEVFPAHARFALDALPALTTRRDQIKSLRQTILNLAVRGKLVEQELNAEPVPSVLQRFNATGSREGAFHLPGTWVWIDVGSVAKTRLGKMLDKAKNRGTPRPYLRNINVRWFDFDLSDLLEMPFENSELEEFSLLVGDVLICEGGEPGRAAVWDARSQGIYFQKAIHRVRFFAPADPHFFVLALKASADDGRLAESFTGTGIKHFTGKGLSGYRFPLPPLAEQHRIVAKVDELMALCDRLEASLATADTTKQRLLEALVQQALEPILKEAA